MLNKNKIIHDLVMLHLEKTFKFSGAIENEKRLAISYETEFDNVKNELEEFNLTD